MYFNYRAFFKAEALALFGRPFSVRRWAYVLLFTGLYLAFLSLVLVGRAIDHVFFGRFRQQKVEQPVFVVAPPRSGTTLVQNLLCLDEQRFVHLKMYQTIFPSVFAQRAIDALAWIDGALGRPLERLMGWCEKKWFGGWDDMHKMRLNQPEEDDALFLYAFESEAAFLLFPFVEELWEVGFPDALPRPARRKLMRYYRSCLQRHLYANAPARTLLSKSTQSSGSLEALLEEFPDAKFITIVRHPYASVASHVSVFAPVWQTHSPDIARDGPVSKAYAQLAVEWYKHLFEFRQQANPKQYYCIDYRDLIVNPASAIRKLYEHFGWSMSQSYRDELAAATRRQREYESKHEYSLEEFGLSREWIQRELSDVLDAYGLER